MTTKATPMTTQFSAEMAGELCKQAREDDAGFDGVFTFYPEDEHCPDRVMYVPNSGDYDEFVVSDCIDENVAEPLVRILNRHRTMADQLEAAMGECERLRKRNTFLESETRRYDHEHTLDLDRLRVERAKVASDEKWIANLAKDADDLLAENAQLKSHLAAARAECEDLKAQLAGAQAANTAADADLVEHVELNGHIDNAEECIDYLQCEADEGGDMSGRMRDFVESLRIVVDQLDRQRRSRNWYEVAYTTGKQKLIESAVAKAQEQWQPVIDAALAWRRRLSIAVNDRDPKRLVDNDRHVAQARDTLEHVIDRALAASGAK